MAYRTTLGGLSIECDTVAELQALVMAMCSKDNIVNHTPTQQNDRTTTRRVVGEKDGVRDIGSVLAALLSAGSDGLDNAKVASIMGLRNPKALGPATKGINKQLAPDKLQDVARIEKASDGSRTWYATPKTSAALQRLKGESTPRLPGLT